jgi:hypothetical protein
MSDFEMRPLIIGIAGGHSGSGKTFIGCKLLERLPGWGAIKYTKTSLYGSVTDDIDVLSEEGKDTKKFLDSGAGKVLWVRSPLHELADTLPVAVEMLSHLNGIMPDIVIFITGPEAKMKEGSEKILRIADVVVSDSALPEAPQNAKIFRIDEVEGILDYVSKLVKEKDKG